MATTRITLALGLKAKDLNRELNKVKRAFSRTITSVRSMFAAAKIGSYLIQGANGAVQEYMAKMRAVANMNEQGFGKEQSERLFELSNDFEKLGYSADSANDAFTQFITTGKAATLQSIGIYLDSNTKSTLLNATAQERLNWTLSQGADKLKEQQKAMPESIRAQIEMKKAIEDTQKAIGFGFMSALNGIIKGLGGVNSALKLALVGFGVYRTAMIVGNVAIGISKAIAQGGAFAAPVAIAMGVSALASIGALVGGISTAIGSLSGPDTKDAEAFNNSNVQTSTINVELNGDRYGQEVVERNGNNGGRVSR